MPNCCHDRARAVDLPLEEEPMKRYIHPICCCPPVCPPGAPPELDGVLEALARQNQLLLDILGAVNALSAAVLSIQSKL